MTYKIFSLGCKVNSYECNAVASRFLKEGYKEASFNEIPDIVLINTCSVTSTADQKSRQHIRKFKKDYPNAIIIVMGCYSQGNYEYIYNEIQPTILIGTSHRHELVELINLYLKTKTKILRIDKDPRTFKYEEIGITSFTENTRAYLKIQDGCDNFCSYCLIPYRRGKMRSRLKEDVLSEATYLIKQGYKEIVLSGIHVGGYGQDLSDCSFSQLVSSILSLPNCPRLRISSIEESEIDSKLISLFKQYPHLCKHLHIPLQSGCDITLKDMNRKYNTDQFLKKLNEIRKECPDIAISTDVIVGFPGESDEHFSSTLSFITRSGINMIHVFPFSPREGTPAFSFKNQVTPEKKKERVNQLISLSKKLWNDYLLSFINKDIEILIERVDSKNHIGYGHSSNYIDVEIKDFYGSVGQFVTVKLTNDLIKSE